MFFDAWFLALAFDDEFDLDLEAADEVEVFVADAEYLVDAWLELEPIDFSFRFLVWMPSLRIDVGLRVCRMEKSCAR